MYLLGIDIGTTNWKAVLYTYSGETVAQSSTPTVVHYGESGRAVYDTNEIWNGVCQLIQDLIAQCRKREQSSAFQPEDIKGVSITGMAETIVPLDSNAKALYPAIAWFDPRTEPQYRWITERDPHEELPKITGSASSPIYSLCKMLWIRENEPDIFAQAQKWLTMTDFMLFKLSGEYATDYSEATRTMCFDITRHQWSEKILQLVGMDSSIFPTPYPSGTVIGKVHAQASKETGLAVGTPVVTGGHDHICGALAAGVFQENVILDSCGTTESLVLSLKHPNLSDTPKNERLTYGCHVARDTYYALAGLYAAGYELQWYKEQFEGKLQTTRTVSDDEIWQGLMNEAQSTPPGAEGVFFLPHSRGANIPPVDPLSCGTLLGLRSHHHRGHILRAVVEGLCYEVRRLLTIMEQAAGTPVDCLRVVGSARNTFWLQVKANVLDKPLEIPNITEGTSLGAAMLAGIATGIYHDEADAFAHMYRPGKVYEPNQEYTERYDTFYHEIFTKIYPTLAPLHHKIAHVYNNSQ